MGKTLTCQNCHEIYDVSFGKWANEAVCKECFDKPGAESLPAQDVQRTVTPPVPETKSAAGPIVSIGLGGAFVGGALGFLLRPASMLLGQLPFETVIMRGANLKGLDQILVPLAEKSFNVMMAGVIIGAVLGLGLGALVASLRR